MATTSYPKSKIKVLLLENIHKDAVKFLKNETFQIECVSTSLDEEELAKRIKDVHVLGIRSKTKITNTVLANADKLLTIGAFCIGTNQIDLEACMTKGVAVFNAPYSNTRSVVELALGEMIMLLRRTFDRSTEIHNGKWNKSAKNSYEIRGKKLGIVGYGNIGSQLSILAEALGMQVLYYDVVEKLALGNAQKCNNLKELLTKSDIITIHVDGNPDNVNIIGDKEFSLMKKGVIFLNLSRGSVVEIKSLAKHIKNKKVAGAAIDVYPEEPKSSNAEFDSGLRNLPNLILTPHVGGSTEESQKNIAEYVPQTMINYINRGNSYGSVNFPNIRLIPQVNAHRFLHIHKNVPGVMGKVNSILAKYDLNIVGQHLKTNEEIGYLISDVNKNYNKKVISDLKKVKGTVKFRVLY
ncbi:MAG: phosphoglycerate dehydrogenase [Bacteroidetes bacterium]|nr:MAG: phosphoglycerate dehydrogenase [Bacteroidota bacterium]